MLMDVPQQVERAPHLARPGPAHAGGGLSKCHPRIMIVITIKKGDPMVQTLLGLAAATLTTGCWLPQLVRSWRTRSAGDLSWLYLLALGSGIALWLAYGVLTSDFVIVLANALTLTAISLLAGIKAWTTPTTERILP